MQINIKTYATISENFKLLIKKDNYEKLIFTLLNASTKLFPNQYEHITSQSHGECDFVDVKTNEKYDAKLPITTQQGYWIGSNNHCFEKWLESMINECSEFTIKKIKQRELQNNIKDIELYKIMKQKIENDKDDENIIFFFPFPIVYETPNGIYGQFCSDILSNIFDGLKEKKIIKDRKIYAIYPCLDNKISIRCLNNSAREWFSSELLDNYIRFDILIDKN